MPLANSSALVCTARDRELLVATGRTTPTLALLLKASQTFDEPFTNGDYLRRRLKKLSGAGWVRQWRYATASQGALSYYKLTPAGYRLVAGHAAALPSKRYFRPVSLGLQEHTQALAEFLVHFLVGVHRAGAMMSEFYPEHDLELKLDGAVQYPDTAIQVMTPRGDAFNYAIELDNGSERLCSRKETDSIAKKIDFYEQYQDFCSRRFRVLFVCTRATQRQFNIQALAGSKARNPDRHLVYTCSLPEFLADGDALHAPCFLDHQGRSQPLLPTRLSSAASRREPAQQLLQHRPW